MSRFPTDDKNMRTAYFAISTGSGGDGPTQVVKPELVSFVMLCCRSFPLKSAITEKNHEKKIREHCKIKPIFHMIARDRRIAENTASDHQRLYENTFQQSGDRQRSSAIIWKHLSAIGRSSAIIWKHFSAIGRSSAIIWKHFSAIGRSSAIIWKYFLAIGRSSAIIWKHFSAIGRSSAIIWIYFSAIGRSSGILRFSDSSDPAIVSDHMETRLNKSFVQKLCAVR